MPKGIRYTVEQKKRMRQRALKLRAQGKTQKATAEDLGVAIMTLKKLLSGVPRPRKISKARSPKRRGLAGLPPTNPVVQLALQKQRLVEIEARIGQLAKEKAKLEGEMKSLFTQLGNEIFGEKPASRKRGRKPGPRARPK